MTTVTRSTPLPLPRLAGGGEARKTRDRLQGLVSTYPKVLEVRRLLAEAYWRDRQFPETGRWAT